MVVDLSRGKTKILLLMEIISLNQMMDIVHVFTISFPTT